MDRSFCLRASGSALAVIALLACGGSDGPSAPSKQTVAAVQVALSANALMTGMQAKATATAYDPKNATIAGRAATWSSDPSGIVSIDAQGAIQAVGAGQTTVIATIDGISGRATLSVVASPDCATAAVVLAIGESRVLDGAQRGAVCVPSGSYSLIALSNSLVANSRTQIEFAGTGFLSAPSTSLASLTRGVSLARADASERIDLDAHLRRLTDLSSARGPIYNRTLNSSAAPFPPNVGDVFPLYAQGGVSAAAACTQRPLIGARVAALGKHVVVVRDTLNPDGGYTDADYQKFADDFDTKVFPVDSANFAPPLVQQQVVAFFTREVNRETPAGAPGGSIVGYFWPPDLEAPTLCQTSNALEMFYVRVPDPTGTINTNKVTKDQAQLSLLGTLVHELQHLINREQRRAKGLPSEEIWLNEGLSTIAQELLFYKLSGLSPKQRIIAQIISQSSVAIDAYNQSIASNFGNLAGYLASPELNTFYASTPFPVQSYGAAWQFLRFAMDRTTLDQTAAWRSVQSAPTTGLGTVKALFGEPATLIRDFAIAQSLFAVPSNAPVTQRFLSWDYRDIYLSGLGYKAYPFHTQQVLNGTNLTILLAGGGAAYMTLDVPSGGIGSAKITSQAQAVSTGIDLILVRTR